MTRSAKREARSAKRGARKIHCGAMLAFVTAVPFVAAVPATVSAPSAVAADVDYFGPVPAQVFTMAIYPGGNDDDLRGVVCESPRTCTPVPFPYLEKGVGAEDLEKALLADTSGLRNIVFGYSQGARVVTSWLEEYAGAVDAPAPDQLSFVVIGNPGRRHGGAHVIWGQPTPDTQYDVLDVARQYDLTADRPDHFRPLAIANAYAGLAQLHGHYEDIDIYDPGNYVWKEGNTTYVFVPTEDLPLLKPLRRLGLNQLADALNGPLKEQIEKAYDRSYLPAQPGWPATPDPEPTALLANSVPEESAPAALTVSRTVQRSVPVKPSVAEKRAVHRAFDADPDVAAPGSGLESDDDHGARVDTGDDEQSDMPSGAEDDTDNKDADADNTDADADGQARDTSSGEDSSSGDAGSTNRESSSDSGSSSNDGSSSDGAE